MEVLEELARRLQTTQELGNIVRTMKTLAAVNIRQYEVAEQALDEYATTIEQGLQIVLRAHPVPGALTEPAPPATLAVVFGSDLGLCGRFNDDIVDHARSLLAGATGVRYLAVGDRAAAQLEACREAIISQFALPGSVHGLTAMARRIVMEIDRQRAIQPALRIVLFHNRRREARTALAHHRPLLPLDSDWLHRLQTSPWIGHCLPLYTMEPGALFAALLAEHLFIALFRAGAASGASEHATRLAAMQNAEHNIEDNLAELTQAYSHQRQAAITAELLDIVAGYEAMR